MYWGIIKKNLIYCWRNGEICTACRKFKILLKKLKKSTIIKFTIQIEEY